METGPSKRIWCIILFIASALICLSSCKDRSPSNSPYQNNLGIKPATIAQIDTANYTTIEWIEPNRNFGTLIYGDSAELKFRFKNTGIHPLFISGVKPSCGCTVPIYPGDAIMPGDENLLNVSFHSIGKADTVYKTILVTSNTSNATRHLLSIHGIVKGRPLDSPNN